MENGLGRDYSYDKFILSKIITTQNIHNFTLSAKALFDEDFFLLIYNGKFVGFYHFSFVVQLKFHEAKFSQKINIFYNEIQLMGCGASQGLDLSLSRIQTVTGTLKITTVSGHMTHEASMFKMDPYIILRMSNQIKTTKVITDGDKSPEWNETFNFFINSCYKHHGRNLEVMVMDKQKVGSDNQIGFGIVDMDPVLKHKKTRDEFRCFINYKNKDAGYVNLIASFSEEEAKTVSFRFQTAVIRKKGMGTMNCMVKVIIGEEELYTSKQKDNQELKPVWKDDILTFNVAVSMKSCQIILMDDSDVIGSFDMEMKEILEADGEKSFNEEFEDDKGMNVGSLKFQTMMGENPTFSEIKTVARKKNKQQVEEDKTKKEEQNKQNNNNEQNNEQNRQKTEKQEDQKGSNEEQV